MKALPDQKTGKSLFISVLLRMYDVLISKSH